MNIYTSIQKLVFSKYVFFKEIIQQELIKLIKMTVKRL